MKSTLRILTFALALGLTASAMAQYPHWLVINGTTTNCYPGQIVNVQAGQPAYNFDVPVDNLTCTFSTTIGISSAYAWYSLSTMCSGMIVTAGDSVAFNFLNDTAYVFVTLDCSGGTVDCSGVLNGPDMPGTSCDDGNALTVNDTWSIGCVCAGTTWTDCLGILNGPNLPGTACDDGDSLTVNDTWIGSCICHGDSSFFFNYDCLGILNGPNMPGTSCVTFLGDTGVWNVNCVCATNSSYDCLGILNGSNLPGTPCTYTLDSITYVTSIWTVNCVCGPDSNFFQYDCMGILNGSNLPGTPCIIPGTILIGTWSASCVCDTNSTYYDCLGILNGPNLPNTPCVTFLGDSGFWNANCVCTMALNNYDCLGILNGPNMPGTSCNDGDTLTTNDTWNGSCVCTGTSILPCQANFWVLQAFGIDSLPVPYELWVWNLSSGGTGVYTFLWSFGDGTSSTDAYPTHTYANSGPYVLCLTIADNGGCTSTFCDSIAINTDGIYTGIMGGNDQRSAGFTINIQNPLSNEVVEHVTTDAISIWPNPVSDALNVALVSTMRGELVSTIIDLDGKVMWSGTSGVAPGRNQMIVPVESLAPGLYVIRINNGTQSTALRFVKR